MSAAASDILVVGSVALDSVRTPFGEVEEALGGSASYFALSAIHFSAVRMVAVVGEDFPGTHRELFVRRGVDIGGLEIAPGRTFRWHGEYASTLEHARTIATQLNVFSSFHPRLRESHRGCGHVFLANIDPDLQLEVLDQMRAPRMAVSDTMDYWIARKPERVLEVLRRVDVALLNEQEARALSGETQTVRATARLLELGARAVVVKKGEDGALYRSPEDLFALPSYPVGALRDPTGAGDSFAGGFVGWLARSGRADGRARRLAMACGAVMASLAIEDFSPARLVEAQEAEIETRLEVLHRMARFELEAPFAKPPPADG